jgi:hypothetical protein
LVSIYKKVKDVLSQEVLDKKGIKAVIILNCKMRIPNDEGETIMTNFKTVATPIFHAWDLDGIVNDMFEKVVREYVEMMLKGSGWALESEKDILIRTSKFCPLGASSYIRTPSCIDVKKCVINVQNFHGHDCFKYSILATFVSRNRHRVQSYKALDHSVNFKGVPMPMPLNFVSKFEKMKSTFSVNIFV